MDFKRGFVIKTYQIGIMTVVMKYLDTRAHNYTFKRNIPHKRIIIMMVFVIFFDIRNNIVALFVTKVLKLPM